MKQIINGRMYDTQTATLITTLDTDSRSDFGWERTSLYRTPKGNYFLTGQGGPMSRWSCKESGGNGWTGGSGIQPLDAAEALAFAEAAYADTDTIALYFADLIVEA